MSVIAVTGVAVGLGGYTDCRIAQAVALVAGIERAGLFVGVGAGPTRVSRVAADVLHGDEIADSIVGVPLKVCSHRVAITGVEQADARRIIVRMRNRRAADLPEVLTAGCLDQAVDGIVRIV